MNTAEILVNAMTEGDNITGPVYADFFRTKNNDDFETLYGLYKGLIRYRGVSDELLNKCLLSNRLEELIHKKYKNRSSGYYNNFKIMLENGYRLDGFMSGKNKEAFEIYDDDHCPNCNAQNYIGNYVSPPDCYICFKIICTKCSKYNRKKYGFACMKHSV
jgi:hypothetical protein